MLCRVDERLGRAGDVSKVYESRTGPVHAFGPVDLADRGGRFVALVGPSGCGKSTLLLMIAGLLEGSAGEIRGRGRARAGPQTDIGMVFQSRVLVDWRTVLGNVLLQIDLRGLRRRDYLAPAQRAARLGRACASSPTATPTSSPAACSSAPPSAAPSSTTRR